ncbi:UDP-N-acetylmuramoyl-L-alanine--D-glutamate ligase [Dehalobacter sp. DCM]|uniref:UDP-N-acetylmuramoyl-L-alanine--D-glutamate ligase n=1 Tax=Dehalobacter sp. DCM TaxID=2907827 RepID=UPI0030817241|nr:UDP-N-acetylmuramoyl-L-alanine--D-glutamate ligase [Dehalobacter sp. DCM]
MELHGKRVLVVGGGRSGLAAAQKLMQKNADVYLTDMQPLSKLTGVEGLGLDKQKLILEQEPDLDVIQPDLLVLSPGVSPLLPFIRRASTMKIPIWSEVELALRDSQATIIGITGSNGKTTTTTLIGELARKTGRRTVVAGNIGLALCGQVEHLDQHSIIVAELSSFQLELIDKIRVNIAVFLNLTPDHLDRHGTIEGYAAAKARILENQTENDLAVLNWDDPIVREYAKQANGRITFISLKEDLAEGICLQGKDILWKKNGIAVKVMDTRELLLRGNHNIENVMAAIGAALELGLSLPDINHVLRRFQPVAHRQEIVGTFNGILYINDSKGTNPDSSIKALQSYEEPVVLIAGGKNKGLDMTEFLEEAKKRIKSLVLVGMAAPEMAEIARRLGIERILISTGFEDAVDKAIKEAVPGDVVLLSPACTSWDMFKNFEERGELFKRLVTDHYSVYN